MCMNEVPQTGLNRALERKANCSTVCQRGHWHDGPGCCLCKAWVMVWGCAAGAQGPGGMLILDAHP